MAKHPPGTKRHRQLLSPYRAAMIAGRYTAGRTIRRRARRGEPIGRRPRRPGAHTAGSASPALPVTVVIPAYNRGARIGRAVGTALRQRPRPPAQVIVVDDCSTDGTAEAAMRAGADVFRHEVNRGAGAARNTAIEHASQPWVAFLDSDDEWLPNHLAALWSVRAGHVLVGGATRRCESGGRDRYIGPVRRGGMTRGHLGMSRPSRSSRQAA